MDVQHHQPNTPIALVIRCLSWFQAFAVLDNLDQLNPKTIDHFMVPSPNTTRLRTWIGKGPLSHDIGTSAFFYSDNGEETYPVFNFPSRSPKGAGVFVSKVNRKLIAHENTALFFLEVATCVPTDPKIFEQVQMQRLEESTEQFIRDSVNAANDILQVIVGIYALYQYPLIWQFLGERHQWSLVNVETLQVTQSYENVRADNFVPFQLNVSSKIASGHLVDGIHSTFSELVKKGPSLPFIQLEF